MKFYNVDTGLKNIILLWILIQLWASSIAQITANKLNQMTGSPVFASYILQCANEDKEFYHNNNYHFCWLTAQGSNNLKLLSKYLQNSSALGLNKEDYQPALFSDFAKGLVPLASDQDSMQAEIKFTDAAIHFLHDVMEGNQPDQVLYNGLNYSASCYNIPALLNAYLSIGKFSSLLHDLEPRQTEYQLVKAKLNFFQKISLSENFKDVEVSSTRADSSNKFLVTRLYQLGYLNTDTMKLSNAFLKEKMKEMQNMFAVLSDGVLRSTTIKAMNVPLERRIEELENTLNSLRWLSCIKQTNHIVVVNIPSANIFLYEHGKIILESRIIVGKKSNPTPTLCSKITEVILYPYWNVPYKIATKELLPQIKRNPGYLDANNYQVLNKQGKVMNASSINWHLLSLSNFPYVIRQSTGCDNALGLIKLNFYNPFSVYLHDTPSKSLFKFNSRYFSHGCMRVQKAMEIGRYVLKDNSIAIDTLQQKGCLKNKAPISVPASEIIPVFVLYHTAWIDAEGSIGFYEDIYDKFAANKK